MIHFVLLSYNIITITFNINNKYERREVKLQVIFSFYSGKLQSRDKLNNKDI